MVADVDSATIEALNRQFSETFERGDFAAIGEMYTEDAVILPPITGIIAGRGNIESFWQQASRIRRLFFETVSVKSLGPNAVRAIGNLRMRIEPPEEASEQTEPREITSKYVFIWRNVGGNWKIETGMWNRIGAPRAPRGGGMRIARGGGGPGPGPRRPDPGPRGPGPDRRGGALDFMRDD